MPTKFIGFPGWITHMRLFRSLKAKEANLHNHSVTITNILSSCLRKYAHPHEESAPTGRDRRAGGASGPWDRPGASSPRRCRCRLDDDDDDDRTPPDPPVDDGSGLIGGRWPPSGNCDRSLTARLGRTSGRASRASCSWCRCAAAGASGRREGAEATTSTARSPPPFRRFCFFSLGDPDVADDADDDADDADEDADDPSFEFDDLAPSVLGLFPLIPRGAPRFCFFNLSGPDDADNDASFEEFDDLAASILGLSPPVPRGAPLSLSPSLFPPPPPPL